MNRRSVKQFLTGHTITTKSIDLKQAQSVYRWIYLIIYTAVKNRVIMVLVYYRLYIIYSLMEFLFGLDQSNVCRDIQKIERLIRRCLPIPQKLYEVTRRLKTKEEVEEYFPGFMAFTDCTEQPIPRPKNRIRKRKFYSGKRKKHTVKNLYTANQKGLIIYKTKHKQRGRKET